MLDFVAYLEALPPVSISKLYSSHWTCQAVLRGLPPLAKQYVMRLLWIDAPIQEYVIHEWPAKEATSQHKEALDKLERLQLVRGTVGKAGERLILMHPGFREKLRWSLTSIGLNVKREVPAAVTAQAPSIDALNTYAKEQWEALLLYVSGSGEQPQVPSTLLDQSKMDLDGLMLEAGLCSYEDGEMALTDSGFHFLLMDTYNQLWLLLKEYIRSAEKRSGAELASVVSFLLQLGFRDVGVPFPITDLTPLEQGIASDMARLGLVFPFRAEGEIWIASTSLAAALGGAAASDVQQVTEGFIVVETNYRVYAYTSSPLQYAILRLFVRCECILPNLFVGTITRESVTSAFTCGLSADQVIDYLRQHASQHISKRVPVVPEVVADQIRLWQADAQRVRQTRAVLYDDFSSATLFEKTLNFAQKIGACLWDDQKGCGRLVARADAHDRIREFIKANK
eukprot:jgi/Botrbrau1/9506/Bobra.0252s0121.1